MIKRFQTKTTGFLKWHVLVLLGLMLCNNPMYGQFATTHLISDPQPQFRNFSVEQGLPSSETYFVHQDQKGYIWICTDRGVARYDGYRFRVFTRKDGLADNVVFKIHEDKKGRLWFISYSGRMCYWDGYSIHLYKFNDRIQKYLKDEFASFKTFDVNEKGEVFFSASHKKLIKIHTSGKVEEFPLVTVGKEDCIQVRYLFNKWAVLPVIVVPPTNPMGRLVVFAGRNGKQTFLRTSGASNHAYTISGPGYAFAQLDATVYDINSPSKTESYPGLLSVNCDGSLLFYGTINGAYIKNVSDFARKKSPGQQVLNRHNVSWCIRDKEGGYWFSTLDAGVFYCPDIRVRTYDLSRFTPIKNIVTVAGHGSRIAIGTTTHCFTLDGEQFCRNTLQSNPRIFFRNGKFCSSSRKMPRIGEVSGDLTQLFWIKDYFETSGSVLMAGAGVDELYGIRSLRRLYSYDYIRNGVKRTFFHGIAMDAKGRIFAGTYDGVYELYNKTIHKEKLKTSLFQAQVTDMDYHPLWGVIVGTKDRGIYFFNDYTIADSITVKDGLLTNCINSLFVDEHGAIWVSTGKGVNKVVRKRNNGLVAGRLTIKHGLPSNEVNAVYVFQDTVWIATKKGLVVTEDVFDRSGKFGNLLSVEYVQTDKGLYRANGRLSFSATTEFINIQFRSSNFRSGNKRRIRYRYSTDGVWAGTSSGELNLTKPRSGEYVLEAMSMNENGIWSSPKVLCRFTVLPPFYATWYFITGMVLLGALGMFLLFRLRLRQLKRKHRLQDTINQLEQKALRAQMNPHFIFNSLNSIQSFLIYEENEKAEKYLLKFAQLIRITLNNSRETYISIEAEIDSLKRYLELEQMRFKDKFIFEIHNGLTAKELKYGVPPMLIQPFVENAVLHGFKSVQSGGVITLRFLSLSNGGLNCEVEDNGVGRKATLQHKLTDHKSFGTKITEERLTAFRQKYGDDFRFEIIDKEENGEAKGTKVVLRIPVVDSSDMDSIMD